MGPGDVVYVVKRWGPRTDPWGTPVTSWCAVDTSTPQATLKDLPVIGFKLAKWNPSDAQWWEGGQEDLMIYSDKSGRQIQQNEDWWFGIGFCNSQGFSDWE